MSEFDDLDMINGAFAELRNETMPFVKPAGTASAHATVRHQKKVRAITVGVFTVLALVVPVAAIASMNPSNAPPTVAGASESPTPSPSASPTRSTPAAAPVTAAELANANLDVPGMYKCDGPAVGKHQFTDGRSELPQDVREKVLASHLQLMKIAPVDVDRDGVPELAALIRCEAQDGPGYQVAVFGRDGVDGIRTLGQVLGLKGFSDNYPAGVPGIRDIAAGDGVVKVQVADLDYECAGCNQYKDIAQLQWREFGWNGQKFTQTGGPSTFERNEYRANTAVTASEVVFGSIAGGYAHGTLTVTVRNKAARQVDVLLVSLFMPADTRVEGTLPAGCTVEGQPGIDPSCTLGSLAPGATKTLVFRLKTTRLSADAPMVETFRSAPFVLVQATEAGQTGELPNDGQGRVDFKISWK
ncbi:hypothetical protein Lfu02_20120 [Longispora fulva]|uniref:Uncharacterized protein n=1 Tax=Longispora fulva TaxID=619741 RepID=A0A8J7GKR3_9ACTN|nr:hypothetical protein [Longispora fulva]MBG6139976.1 hypothetical protein [Longispora fulva]GIG57640.1 hypothetical protein Lfu02_20120 [Longispora fulva]